MSSIATVDMKDDIQAALQQTQKASRKINALTDSQIREVLYKLSDLAWAERDYILAENKKDLDRMNPENPKYDRLLLNEDRLEGICADLKKVADLPSPLHKVLEESKQPNGMSISRVTVPMGVIGIVYESRPNVTFDVFALCLKSGNACVLKGSRDAKDSNIAIVSLIHQVLQAYGLEAACYLAPADREALPYILEAEQYIDVMIPRGSQGLINFVRDNARVPVIETGAGIVHVFLDESGRLDYAKSIVTNSKARRVSVCNALDCLVIHESRLNDLPEIMKDLDVKHKAEVYADEQSYEVLKDYYSAGLLHKASADDFGREFLSMKMSVKTVHNMDEAIDHVAKYSSKHSETIISENQQHIDQYLLHTDAACVYANVSTAFSDGGQFGLGAEIGISTQKLHARGPMGLRELTSYKWIIKGDGQVRD